MPRSFIFSRLLAILVIAGLITAPLSAAVAASAGAASMSMKGDMPCCPDKSSPGDCDKCPLMALCMDKTVQSLPSYASAALLFSSKTRALVPLSDPEMDSIGYSPPPRPPRSPVLPA